MFELPGEPATPNQPHPSPVIVRPAIVKTEPPLENGRRLVNNSKQVKRPARLDLDIAHFMATGERIFTRS